MNDQELRHIVRQAISKLAGAHAPTPAPPRAVSPTAASIVPGVEFVPESVPFGDHVSHAMYLRLVNTSSACVIEEHVSCDHCGYCKSHGH